MPGDSDRQDAAPAEPMTEEKVAALEAEWRHEERAAEASEFSRSGKRIFIGRGVAGVSVAEKTYLLARAQLDRQQRAEADRVARETLAINAAMAEASKLAATASADSARWAKWAAIATAVAAVVGLIQAFVAK